MATTTKQNVPDLPLELWTMIIDSVHPDDDFERFAYMSQYLRPVSRLFKAAVDHLFTVKLIPQFVLGISVPHSFKIEKTPVQNTQYELRAVFDRLSTVDDLVEGYLIFRIIRPKRPQNTTEAAEAEEVEEAAAAKSSTEATETLSKIEIDKENEPSRELKELFLDETIRRSTENWICGRHYVGSGPTAIDRRRQEIYLNEYALSEDYFRFVRRERKSKAKARAAEVAALGQALGGLSLEVEKTAADDINDAEEAEEAEEVEDSQPVVQLI